MMKSLLIWIGQNRKALAGALVAGIIGYFKIRNHGINDEEWIWLIGYILAGGGIVWSIPNEPTKKQIEKVKNGNY